MLAKVTDILKETPAPYVTCEVRLLCYIWKLKIKENLINDNLFRIIQSVRTNADKKVKKNKNRRCSIVKIEKMSLKNCV